MISSALGPASLRAENGVVVIAHGPDIGFDEFLSHGAALLRKILGIEHDGGLLPWIDHSWTRRAR